MQPYIARVHDLLWDKTNIKILTYFFETSVSLRRLPCIYDRDVVEWESKKCSSHSLTYLRTCLIHYHLGMVLCIVSDKESDPFQGCFVSKNVSFFCNILTS